MLGCCVKFIWGTNAKWTIVGPSSMEVIEDQDEIKKNQSKQERMCTQEKSPKAFSICDILTQEEMGIENKHTKNI